MKKLLLLVTIFAFLFGCRHHTYPDALKTMLAPRAIPEAKAIAMKNRAKANPATSIPKNYVFDMVMYRDLVKYNDDVYIIPVVYSNEDRKEYCEAWGIPLGDPKGEINGYSSFIIQVGTNTNYYNFVQICPPPETCPQL
jgi:nitrate reductase beta subunit